MTSRQFLRWAVVASLPALLLLFPLPTCSAGRPATELSISESLLASRGLVRRYLRADFESPGLLVLAYDSDWLPSIERILAAARGRAAVAIAPVADDADGRYLRRLTERPGVIFLDTLLDTAWVRDFAPLQQRDPQGAVFWHDFPYSAERPLDDAFPEYISRRWRARYERGWLSIDGGAVISNGEGLCAMTDVSVEDTRLDVRTASDAGLLLSEVGCDSIVVVPALPGEETGHVDMIAQFVAPDSLIVASTDPTIDPFTAAALDDAAKALQKGGRKLGKKLSVTRVPYEVHNDVHLTYVNGTPLHGSFLAPRYDTVDPALQARAYRALRRAMPGRRLVPVDADAMMDRGGAVHCITAGLDLPEAAVREVPGWRAALPARLQRGAEGHPRLAKRRPPKARALGGVPGVLRGVPAMSRPAALPVRGRSSRRSG